MELIPDFSQNKRYRHRLVRLDTPFEKLIDQNRVEKIADTRTHIIYFMDKWTSKYAVQNPRFFAVNKQNRFVDMTLDGTITRHGKSMTFAINTLEGRSGSNIKAYEFYRAILLRLPVIFTSDKQSYGGMRTWQELSRYPDMEVFGWYNGKPVNIDPLDSDETHADEKEAKSGDGVSRQIMDMILVAHRKIGGPRGR